MEHIIEGILEFLFSFAKKKTEERPCMELQETFTVRHNKTASRIVLLVLLLAVVVFLVLSCIVDNDTRILFYVFCALFAILFFLYLFLFSIKCDVTSERIQRTTLFSKKEIPWSTIVCVRIVEQDGDSNHIIALYDHNKTCVADVSTDMENAWYIVKLAESKNIEIREEKNLTIRQLKRL